MEATEDVVCLDENHSSNAIRNNGLEKYSRFHGKNEFSVCANSPNTKLTNGVRELVYQMSPYNITCVYKKVFETCALNCLRSMEFGPEEQELGGTNPSPTKIRKSGNSSEPTTPRSSEPLLVNRSNSCVYSSSSETQSGTKRSPSHSLCGWSICKRPHSAVYVGVSEHQRTTVLDELREPNKRPPGKPSYCSTLPNRFGAWRQTSARASYHSSPDLLKYRKPSRDRVDDSSSVNIPGSVQKSPIKVGRHFKHFRRNTSYMDQYREEYTYRKLRDLTRPASVDSLVCRCGSPNCSSSRSTPCLSTWQPIQSQLVRPMSLPRDMSSLPRDMSNMAAVTSPMPPMKTPTIPLVKKRLQMANYVKQLAKSVGEHSTKKLDKPSVTGLPPETAKVEFFSSSLTVNNYNPTSTVKQSQSSVRIGGPQGHVRQLGTPCKTRDCAASPNMTASERFYQNKNDRCQ